MKETIYIEAKAEKIDDHSIESVIGDLGIVMPSTHLAFFRSIYAEVEIPNKNKIILSKEAVVNAIDGLRFAQINFSHIRKDNICGTVLGCWLNEDNQIEIIFSFFKDVYKEEYLACLDSMEVGELTVSFELCSSEENQINLADGNKRLLAVDFRGVGLLRKGETPACPAAMVFETAMKRIDNLLNQETPELVFANVKEVSKYWSKIGEKLEKVIDNVKKEEAVKKYDCQCIDCGKIIKSTEHCKDIKCPDCSGEMRRKDRPGSGDQKAQNDSNEKINEKGEKLKMDEKNNKILDAKLKEALVEEFGEEITKEWADEDFLNEDKITATRKSIEEAKIKEDEKIEAEKKASEEASKVVTEEKVVTTREDVGDDATKVTTEAEIKEKTDDKVTYENKTKSETVYTWAQVEEIKAEYDEKLKSKDEEIAKLKEGETAIKENATKVAEIKAELGDFVKDFSDEDFLNEDKVENAKLRKQNEELKAKKEEEETPSDVLQVASVKEEKLETGHKKVPEVKKEEKCGAVRFMDAKYKEIHGSK